MVFSENGSVAPRIEACLKAVGGAFGRDKSGTVLIEAHCDKPGSQSLTADQAVQVARFMTQNSALDSQRLRAVGRADSAPRFAAASQESALGHNSRIELSLRAR
jgi:flagellar motor protein MotB